MSRDLRYKSHSNAIETWIKSIDDSFSILELTNYFETALNSLLSVAQVSISEIALAAILERIIYNSAEQYIVLKSLKTDGAKLDFSDFKKKTITNDQAKEAFHYFITEFFFIVGNITAEQFTPILYRKLKTANDQRMSKPKESK